MDVDIDQIHLPKLIIKVVALHGAYKLIKIPALWFKCIQVDHPSISSHFTLLDNRDSRDKVCV